MKHHPICLSALVLAVFLAAPPWTFGQSRPPSDASSFRPGLEFEYGSRTVGWTENGQDATSRASFWTAGLVLEYRIRTVFSVAARVGYSSTSFDALTFRQLPLSIELETGGMGGLLLGAEVEKSITSGEAYSLDLAGQFLASLGFNKKWDVPGLAVEGTVEGKSTWMRAVFGPIIAFRGWPGIVPFLFPRLDYFWGQFKLDESVQELQGSEQKDLKGKAIFGLALGADLELSERLFLRCEGAVYPREGGTDFSLRVRTLYAF
ncbi:MAG: hypothetical protein JXE07_01200 [Candidatus Aminicenantes bacterium]|nr:hypothetical protein [Candidatus Aminicenantes bacterium]